MTCSTFHSLILILDLFFYFFYFAHIWQWLVQEAYFTHQDISKLNRRILSSHLAQAISQLISPSISKTILIGQTSLPASLSHRTSLSSCQLIPHSCIAWSHISVCLLPRVCWYGCLLPACHLCSSRRSPFITISWQGGACHITYGVEGLLKTWCENEEWGLSTQKNNLTPSSCAMMRSHQIEGRVKHS